MALNVAWRWSMPQVADPNAQANDMAAGIQGLTQGIGRMIGGIRQENREDEQRRQTQENWERTFDESKLQRNLQQQNWLRQFAQNKMQAAQQQENWEKQFAQNKSVQDLAINQYNHWMEIKQGAERLRKLMDRYEKFSNRSGAPSLGGSEAEQVMLGLNPLLMTR